MPRVFIIPHYENEALFPEIAQRGNSAQADFKFHILPPDKDANSPLHAHLADFRQVLPYLEEKKSRFGADRDDLAIALFDGVLTAREAGLSNLFMAGSRYDEPNPCTAVISLRFISWGILEQKFDYDLQRHALLHLVICGLLGAYTHVDAHRKTYGCLFDFDARLSDFNRKLQRGYYLCSPRENNCHHRVQKEKFGDSIIQLCSTFKYQVDQSKLQLAIGELVMGNKIMGDNFAGIENATIINRSTVVNAFNTLTTDLDAETADALLQIAKMVEGSKNQAAAALFNGFSEELCKQDQDKGKLRQYWDGLVAVLPSIAALGESVAKIVRIFTAP